MGEEKAERRCVTVPRIRERGRRVWISGKRGEREEKNMLKENYERKGTERNYQVDGIEDTKRNGEEKERKTEARRIINGRNRR